MENKGIFALPRVKITCHWFWNPFHLSPTDQSYTMALCVRALCTGQPGPTFYCLPTGGDQRRAQSSIVGEDFGQAQRCCWISFRSPCSAGGAQRGKQTELGDVENAESWSWWKSAHSAQPGASTLPTCSCNNRQGHSRQRGLGIQGLYKGGRAGNRHSSLQAGI